MAIVSDVEIRLRADIARLQQDMTRARQSVSSFTNDAKSMLKGFAAGFSAVAIVREVVSAQREFDKLHSSLVTATGSSKSATQAFTALQKLAATTPFSLKEVTEGFLKLRNLGLTPSEKALISYGNTASAMGKSLNQMVEAVADAATGEFERLKEFGVKAKQNGDKVALTFQGTTKTIGNNAAEIEAYLMAIGEVNFAGGMERQAATLDGALSNLSDTWSQTLTSFSQSGFGDVVHGSVLALTGALSDLGAMFKAVSGAASEEGGKVAEIGPLHKALTTVFETITVLGVNVAYVFKAIGKDLGAFAAQAGALFSGGMKGLLDGSTLKAVQAIGKARVEDSVKERAEVEATSARILQAASKNQEAQAEEAAARAKGTKDALEQYKIKSTASKQLTDQQKKELQAHKELQAEADKQVAATARLAAGLDAFNQGQKLDADLTDDIRLKKVKLNAVQEKALRTAYAQISANVEAVESQKRYKEMQEHLAEAEHKLADERAHVIRSAEEEAEGNEKLAKTFGLTAAAVAQLEVARLKEQLAQHQGGAFTLDEIEQLEKVIALKERSAKALANVEQLEKVRDFWTSVEKTAHDTFVSIADGGKDLGKRLKDTLKNTFFDWLYQMTLKKWIINISTSSEGGGLASSAMGMFGSGSGSTASAANMMQMGSSIYKAISGGFGSLSTSVADAVQAGMYQSGMSTSIASNGSFATGAGSAASVAAGMIGGHYLGNAISGGIGIGNHEQAVNNTGTVAGAGIGYYLGGMTGAAIGALIGGAAGGLLNRIFGMGRKEYSDTSTINGMFGAGGFSGTVDTPWTQKGGWFHSDKSDIDKVAVDATVAGGLASAYDLLKTAAADYAKVLGLNADSIANRTQALSIALGKDDAANQEAINKFFAGVSDSIASELLPGIVKFQVEGETTSGTLHRLATDFKALDGIFAAIGQNAAEAFKAPGVAAIEARERLLQFAGGLDALAAQTTFYYQNFLTDGERVALMQKPLADNLAALGFAGLTTADQFKAAVDGLVKSGAVATEEGAKQYAGLLALAPQFKTVADYLEEVGDAAAQTARDLADAQAAMVASNREMLSGLASDALAAVDRSVDAEKTRIEAAFKNTMDTLDAGISRVNDTIARTGALSKALKGAITAQPGGDSAARSQVARAEITAALAIAKASGVLPTPESIADALATVARDNSDDFSTLADYQRAVARTNAELEALGGLTDGQLDTAQRQLQVLEAQKTEAQAAHDAEIERLDAALAKAQEQIDAVNGVNTSVLKLSDAVAALATILGALKSAPTSTGGDNPLTVDALYRQVLNRAPDAEGYAFWKKAYGDTVDQSEYLDFMKAAMPELQGLVKAPPTVADTSSATMSGSSAMSVEQQRINERMEASMSRTATAVEQLAQQFNNVSGGGNTLLVEPA